MNDDSLNLYKNLLTNHLGTDNVFLYWKARIGLYAILKTMGVSKGDEVIVPAYTCVVVPNAIIYLGAKPVYVDIDKTTFNTTTEKVKAAITVRTKVIVCQNTYGLSSELNEIQAIATQNSLHTIEDCTHGFGGSYEGVKNGLTCDAAIFSTQWNKPFSTGVGGFAVIKDGNLQKQIAELNKSLIKPRWQEVTQLRALVLARKYLMNDKTYWPLLRLYRWLSTNNLVVGSSSSGEINSTTMPVDYFQSHTAFQAKVGIAGLSKIDGNLQTRKQVARHYSKTLVELSKNHVATKLEDNHSFLKYPLLVKDRDEFMRKAEVSKVELGDWFTAPLHPVSSNLQYWFFNEELFPNAVFCSRHVINLPTTPYDLVRVTDFLIENREFIFDA